MWCPILSCYLITLEIDCKFTVHTNPKLYNYQKIQNAIIVDLFQNLETNLYFN